MLAGLMVGAPLAPERGIKKCFFKSWNIQNPVVAGFVEKQPNIENEPFGKNLTKEEYISKENEGQVEAFEKGNPLSLTDLIISKGIWKIYIWYKIYDCIIPNNKMYTIYNKN